MDLNKAQLLAIEYSTFIFNLFLVIKCMFLKKENMSYLLRYMLSSTLLSLINIPVRYVELKLVTWNRSVIFWMYDADLILTTFCCAYWCMFLLKIIKSRLVSTKFRTHLILAPAAFIIPLCIINRRTFWLYQIDEFSHYSRGSVFILQTIISYSYLLLYFIFNVERLVLKKDIKNLSLFLQELYLILYWL